MKKISLSKKILSFVTTLAFGIGAFMLVASVQANFFGATSSPRTNEPRGPIHVGGGVDYPFQQKAGKLAVGWSASGNNEYLGFDSTSPELDVNGLLETRGLRVADTYPSRIGLTAYGIVDIVGDDPLDQNDPALRVEGAIFDENLVDPSLGPDPAPVCATASGEMIYCPEVYWVDPNDTSPTPDPWITMSGTGSLNESCSNWLASSRSFNEVRTVELDQDGTFVAAHTGECPYVFELGATQCIGLDGIGGAGSSATPVASGSVLNVNNNAQCSQAAIGTDYVLQVR